MGEVVRSDREKWDSRYADQSVEATSCSRVLAENSHLLPKRGRALDLACGLGGASVHLALHGLDVVAWDVSPVAIDKLRAFAQQHRLAIAAEAIDVTGQRIAAQEFDVIHVSRYLDRGLCASLSRALRGGGMLFYQAFSMEALDTAPRMNPDYCLVRGELLDLFDGLAPVVYREDGLLGDTARGLRNEVLLVAQKRRQLPRFFTDWVQRASDGADAAALSRAIVRHRRRLALLEDHLHPLATGDAAAREEEWGLIENADVVIVPDTCVPQLRALVVPKNAYVLPTDVPEADLHRLGFVVDAISDAFRRVTGVTRSRCWVPDPGECQTRRLHIFVDPQLRGNGVHDKRAVWNEVAVDIRRALASTAG